MDMPDPYQPCPCGSGKKYKFCCKLKQREHEDTAGQPRLRVLPASNDLYDDAAALFGEGNSEEGRRLLNRGLALMREGRYRQAISWFEKAHTAVPVVFAAANNWAACLFVTGQLEAAIAVQRKGIECSPLANPYGQANLAALLLVAGEDAQAEQALAEALEMEMLSEDACVKVCQTLARYKRHQDILDVADDSDFADDPHVCFFTGVAAANLGKRERALTDLRRVPVGHPKVEMVQRYLVHLEEKSTPHTVMGDWPYLVALEICPIETLKAAIKKDQQAWGAGRIALQVCEAMLNDFADDPVVAMELFAIMNHPETDALLWRIVKGRLGPDELRMRALTTLQRRGACRPGDPIDIWLNGQRTSVAAGGVNLDSDYRFGPALPPAQDKLFTKAVKDCRRGAAANWKRNGADFQRVMREAPDFFPARYNYAVCLLHCHRSPEAEPILRDLVAAHPDYLFAPATLLQIYTQQDRHKEARQLIKAMALPATTHPDAFTAWLIAQALYHESQNDFEATRRCVQTARSISPDNPGVVSLWSVYG